MLKYISELAERHGVEIFLTGGAVRDLLLDLPVNDYDFALKEKVEVISREFANKISGKHIELDRQRKIFRVIKESVYYDFSQFRGENILKDLMKRDFTINSLALSHHNFFLFEEKNEFEKIPKNKVIDPVDGIIDLNIKNIRAVSPDVFNDDPLRLIRAVRLKGKLKFQIENKTENLISKNKKLIASCAPERIRDEIYKIFSFTNTADILKYMEEDLNLLSEIFPYIDNMKNVGQCQYHKENVWEHSLHMIKLFRKIVEKNLLNFLPSKSKQPLIKLAAFFHDIGKDFTETKESGITHFHGHADVGAEKTEKIISDLKFSNNDVKYIKNLIKYHMQPLYLYIEENVSDKAFYRFFNRAGKRTPDVCFLSALDVGSTRKLNEDKEKALKYWEYINDILNKYYNMVEKSNELLLDGKDIMKITQIEEGPEIGRLLKKLREAQALGNIKKYEEAVEFIKNIKN